MPARDPHRFVNELDKANIERLITRLEGRAKDKVFTNLFDKYAAQLPLPHCKQILEVGCGTGAVMRFLARREDFSGKVLGIDHCLPFLKAAQRFTHEEGFGDRIEFRIGDVHKLDFPTATYDVVIAHTLISHVTAPTMVLREMARVLRPGGTIVVFDGDYASLSYGFADRDFGHHMDVALANATFNNPLIMRDLPRLLPELGLKMRAAWGDAVAEIGQASYFRSFAETYAPAVIQAGLMPAEAVEFWLSAQQRSMMNDSFFASCNYYTYLLQHA